MYCNVKGHCLSTSSSAEEIDETSFETDYLNVFVAYACELKKNDFHWSEELLLA